MESNNQSVGQFVSVNELKPHPKNPRSNDEAVQSIANSINRFGFTSPIIANSDGTILCGHTRFKASRKLGLETVPVIYVDLTPTDAELLMIADNKLGEKAEWDTDKLSSLLIDLRDQGEDLDILGFEDDELNDLLDTLTDAEDFGDGNGEPASYEENTCDLSFQLLKGNCLDTLKTLESNSIDAIVTDPPYELGFMGRPWDSTGIAYSEELWSECFRVLKHGGHLVAFSGSRTVFPMGVALAEVGFEVRDMISWVYTSGFPKSLDISKQIDKMNGTTDQRKKIGEKQSGIANSEETGRHTIGASKSVNLDVTAPAHPDAIKWAGWGTALKPAQEPAVFCRKPIDPDCKNVAENVLKWGTGAINIEAARFPYGDDCHFGSGHDCSDQWDKPTIGSTQAFAYGEMGQRDLDQKNDISAYKPKGGRWPSNVYQCKKPQRTEKEEGLDHLNTGVPIGFIGRDGERWVDGNPSPERANFHPTVKPQKLMRWLCRLLCPPNGTVLDPFLGSGTTAVSAILEGFNAVGCEMTEDYFPIIEGRVNWAMGKRERDINGPKE